jgi:hypothetical protein
MPSPLPLPKRISESSSSSSSSPSSNTRLTDLLEVKNRPQLTPIITEVLQLHSNTPTQPAPLDQTFKFFELPSLTFSDPFGTDTLPKDAAVVLMDFSTIPTYPEIRQQSRQYLTDFCCVVPREGGWHYYDYICDDPETRSGDYFYLFQVLLLLMSVLLLMFSHSLLYCLGVNSVHRVL